MQNDKNINNEFLALVYGPPAYELNKNEIYAYLDRISHLLKFTNLLSINELEQLRQYYMSYSTLIEKKQYTY